MAWGRRGRGALGATCEFVGGGVLFLLFLLLPFFFPFTQTKHIAADHEPLCAVAGFHPLMTRVRRAPAAQNAARDVGHVPCMQLDLNLL